MARSIRNFLAAGCALGILTLATSEASSGEKDKAKPEADRFIKDRFTIRQDGSVFSRRQVGPIPGMGDPWSESLWQFDGFSWELYEEGLSHADKLNGLTWKGFVGVKVKAYRTYYARHAEALAAKPCWRSWKDVPAWADRAAYDYKWPLQQINGVWKRQPENSGHWLDDNVIPGEDAKAPSEQDISRALSYPPC
ncbi:hypothetical protein V1283_003321 [Bradyrhizobium sp. AZCC 2262]|uniref:hypothetical protein n=1 Tax=Bradyrhizobium sp. AZCC 2262 TaxID=3117022 RepID=UPI002FF40F93